MKDVLHNYTAGELLKWLDGISINEYCSTKIAESVDGDSFAYDVLDIEKITTDFIRQVRRYEVVKRGKTLYIHDNKDCKDILSWSFTDENYEYMQNTANNTCESLNNNTMRFIGKRDKCL